MHEYVEKTAGSSQAPSLINMSPMSSRAQSPARPPRQVQYPWVHNKLRSRRNSASRSIRNSQQMPWESIEDLAHASPNKMRRMEEACEDLQLFCLGLRQEFCDVIATAKNLKDINLDNILRIAEGHGAEISKTGIKLSQQMQEIGLGTELSRRQLRSYCNFIAYYINPDRELKTKKYLFITTSIKFRIQYRASQVHLNLERLAASVSELQRDFRKLSEGVKWPPRPATLIGTDAEYCIHRLPTMCQLTAGCCCACSDRRPFKDAYELYIDGRKTIMDKTRWKHYCPSCTAYWEVQSKTRQQARTVVQQNIVQNQRYTFVNGEKHYAPSIRSSRGKSALSFIGATGPRRSCLVCDEYKPENDFPVQITRDCQHDVSTCKSCLQAWIHMSVTSNSMEKIPCVQCSLPMQGADIQQHASAEDFDLYDSMTFQTYNSPGPQFRWCINPVCGSGQLHDERDALFVCCACNTRSCARHACLYHDGLTCEAFERFGGTKALKRHLELGGRRTSSSKTSPAESVRGRSPLRNGYERPLRRSS